MPKETRAKPLRCPYCRNPMQTIRFIDHDGHRVCRECRGTSPAVRLEFGSDTSEAARQIDIVVAPILQRIERDRAIAEAALEVAQAEHALGAIISNLLIDDGRKEFCVIEASTPAGDADDRITAARQRLDDLTTAAILSQAQEESNEQD